MKLEKGLDGARLVGFMVISYKRKRNETKFGSEP